MRAAVLALLVLAAAARPAQALTIRDVIELTKAGLADEVLIALIEVDGRVYATDTATLKSLKEAGVSDRVMVALIRSGRERRPEDVPQPVPVDETAAATAPPVVIIEHHDVEHHEPQVQQVAVPVPVYVPVYSSRPRVYRDDRTGVVDSTYVPFQSGQPAVRPRQDPGPSSVYWGFGGKLRPDAWGQPPAAEREKAREKEKEKEKADEGDRKRPPKK